VDFNNHSLNTGEAHLQITAYGSDSTYCKVSHWNNAAGVRVHCFDSAGAVVDSRFTLALLDHWQGYP
jgi:hypothetical protein